MKKGYDYIIIGAGTAGCVLAHRLSEDGRYSVLLIEHGQSDRKWILEMPAGLRSVFKPNSKYNYWYKTTPQAHLNFREIDQPRGKALGGSSSINGMTFLRGNPRDYDDWAELEGCHGWSFADCLPYFKKSERRAGPADEFRSNHGIVGVKTQRKLSALNAAFLEAGTQAGLHQTDDVNGYRQEGVSRFEMSVEKGYRSSASRTYLRNQPQRKNLDIATGMKALRIVSSNGHATAVEVASRWRNRTIEAKREIIVSAGVFGTPQLLMLSGIGPQQHLKLHGIHPVLDMPMLGENLQDHLEAHIQIKTDKRVSLNRHLTPMRKFWAGIQWFGWKGGVAAVNQCHVGAFVRTDPFVTHPNIQFHFFPVFFGENWIPDPKQNGYRLGAGPLRPQSRGTVRLASNNPDDPLVIDPNYLATDQDRYDMRKAIQMGRVLLSQEAFKPFHSGEHSPGPDVHSNADLDEYIKNHATSAYHPCGTARMGNDDDHRAVVDLDLKLRGIDGLRVVDASVIPAIPSANINACVFMIAEKAADKILGYAPLPAEHVEYHRP